jgi:glycosyltransferase involved in cell wall biosynthesis
VAVLRLAADPALRDAMGREGRRRFAHQFRHETMTDQLRALYERLLGEADRPPVLPAVGAALR